MQEGGRGPANFLWSENLRELCLGSKVEQCPPVHIRGAGRPKQGGHRGASRLERFRHGSLGGRVPGRLLAKSRPDTQSSERACWLRVRALESQAWV